MEKLVTVGQYMNNAMASIDAHKLAAHDIESFIADEHVSSIYTTGNVLGIKLQVREADKQRAKDILEDSDA